VELESQVGAFRDRGLKIAALSYDSAEVLKDFAARRGISFPLLSDQDSSVIRAFGLLNEVDYPVGNFAHGVPFPGVFIVDASGVVRRKTFEKTYQERRTAASLLLDEGVAPGAAVVALQNAQFTLKTSLSNHEAAIGQRITLMLDFEMGPKMHAYAPGVKGYRPLSFRLDPHPLIAAREVVHPASKPYRFEPLNETVPVYEGAFRLTQDLTVQAPSRPAPGEPAATPITEIPLTGTLDYQTCSDTVCHAPATAPLSFTIRLKPLDRERSPEALRRRP
jgi:AhpC/TSA family/Disulphide bond corrector protein DsbC